MPILPAMRLLFVIILGLACAQTALFAGTLAQFRTVLGDLEVELFDANKPVTVSNFIKHVQSGAYDDIFIQRWEPGFVIQAGGFKVNHRGETNAEVGAVEGTFGTITNEYGVGRRFSNLYGTIAMARQSGITNSATSQWFFNLTNNAFLDQVDGGFTVFGRVRRGTNVLERFNDISGNGGIYRLNLDGIGGPLGKVPVVSRQPTFNDFIYVDISLLNVQVAAAADGTHEISWRSVSNLVNRVEYTAEFPPVWTELIQTNGTGGELRVLDTQPDRRRFYRVRVDY